MKPEILYHYCPSDSFVAIIKSRQLRLSSLALGNDWMEGRIPFRVLRELLEGEDMRLSERMRLTSILATYEETQLVYGLGFCLSVEGDLLSQWRGYASDGSGVAIGFRREFLEEVVEDNRERLPELGLHKVKYGDEPLRDELVPRAKELINLIGQGALTGDDSGEASKSEGKDSVNLARRQVQSEFYKVLVSVKLEAYRFKTDAFREEGEYRLLATSRTEDEPPNPDILNYRAAADRILAYATVNINESETSGIKEVVLGPKHATRPEVVEEFLELNGFENVSVWTSSASYT
jgi:hypothetical protein